MNKILEIKNLSVSYPNTPKVLDKVNLDVYENDFLGIIGPNGGGKTSLLKAILGLIAYNSGEISFYKRNNPQKINIGYLPQTNLIDKDFPITVYEVVLSGLRASKNILRPYTKEQKQEVHNVAKLMGVENYLNKAIGKLSGGQLQRALLGRAIIDKPDLLILDEPNSYVDKKFESDFYTILKDLNKSTAIIMVSHDVGTVMSMVKNIACVNGGLHYHAGSNISTEWLEESYGSYPVEIVGHGYFPHRVLENHDECECCK